MPQRTINAGPSCAVPALLSDLGFVTARPENSQRGDQSSGITSLSKGDRVEYRMVAAPDGRWRAADVRLV
jgi:hypothetical protein